VEEHTCWINLQVEQEILQPVSPPQGNAGGAGNVRSSPCAQGAAGGGGGAGTVGGNATPAPVATGGGWWSRIRSNFNIWTRFT
jgi:hypothetical protein